MRRQASLGIAGSRWSMSAGTREYPAAGPCFFALPFDGDDDRGNNDVHSAERDVHR